MDTTDADTTTTATTTTTTITKPFAAFLCKRAALPSMSFSGKNFI